MNRRAQLAVVGLSFHEVGLEGRVRALESLPALKRRIVDSLSEYVILTTCNRVEIFYFDEIDPKIVEAAWGELVSESFRFVSFKDFEAVRHLFRVTSSLESMVVGETQITGQVKEAYERAVTAQTARTVLHKLFQRAFRVAKKVRADTEVGRFPVSIPSIAVKLAEKVMGSLTKRTIGIVGLGEMGRLAAEYFASSSPQRLLLMNRTEAKAHDLAKKMRSENMAAEVCELSYLWEHSDVIVSAVSGTLNSEADCLRSLSQRLVIDLSVPASLKNVAASDHYYFGIDDLEKIAQENRGFRQSELQRAEDIIQQETNRFWGSLRAFLFHELFETIESRMSSIRAEELKVLRSRLSDLSDSDWMEVERTAERMVSRVLQEPMKTVKTELQAGQADESDGVITFFRHLFKV